MMGNGNSVMVLGGENLHAPSLEFHHLHINTFGELLVITILQQLSLTIDAKIEELYLSLYLIYIVLRLHWSQP